MRVAESSGSQTLIPSIPEGHRYPRSRDRSPSMAKKKSSVVAVPAGAPVPPADHLPEQLENLKSLNQFLLKETVERREQVSSLQSSLHCLSLDHSLSSDLERSVTGLVVAYRLAELGGEIEAAAARARAAEARVEVVAREKVVVALERDSALEDLSELKRQAATVRSEAEKRKSDLLQTEDRVRSLEEENAAMDDMIRSMEEALRRSSNQLESIKGEKSEALEDLQRAVLERDNCEMDLDALSRALQSAQEQLQTSQAANSALKEEIIRMQIALEEERTNIFNEVDSLKDKLQSNDRMNKGLMQEKVELETEIADLQRRVSEFDVIAQGKLTLENKLRLAEEAVKLSNEHLDVVAAEKDDIKRALGRAKTERDMSLLKLAEEQKWKALVTKETERLRTDFCSLEKEREKLQLQIKEREEDYVKQLDVLRHTVQKIEEEKDEINRMRRKQEDETTSLRLEVAKFLETVSQLQEMCRANTEHNAQLQADNESYSTDLHLKSREVDALRLQVDELKKSKDDVQNELHHTKASLVSLIAELENAKGDFCSLTTEKTALEEKLQNALHACKELEGKSRAAEEEFGRVLSLLKATSEAVDDLVEGKRELDASPRNLEEEFEVITAAFKSKVAKTEDMNQELEVLRSAMAESKKKAGVLSWIYPAAATFLAAISLAYAAKCR